MQDYTIRKGDYLGKIAKDAEISLRDLLKINPQIKDPNKIMPGEKIKLPSSYAPPPKFDDEDEFAQESYEDRIIEFFGHYIAAEVMLPGSKKAKRMKEALANELNSEYQQGNMSDAEGKQFFSGYIILEKLSYSLGGEHGIQSAMRRYLINNEVRPIVVKGYEVSRSDYQFFADAWQRISMSEYGYTGKETSLTGKPMSYAGDSNNIFENYFKQNIKEEDVNLDVDADTDLGQMVATMVNQALNTLEDTNPAKNRQTGLDMIAQIRQKLQDPAVVGQIVEDEVQKMLAELA